jgi:hypothetical protein
MYDIGLKALNQVHQIPQCPDIRKGGDVAAET